MTLEICEKVPEENLKIVNFLRELGYREWNDYDELRKHLYPYLCIKKNKQIGGNSVSCYSTNIVELPLCVYTWGNK